MYGPCELPKAWQFRQGPLVLDELHPLTHHTSESLGQDAQVAVQPPQLTLLVSDVSQPLWTSESQSLHAAYAWLFEVRAVAQASMTQVPLAQCAILTCGSFAQSLLHCPQLAVSAVRSTPPMHGPHAENTPLSHVRVCVPVQLQGCDSGAAPQFCPVHEPH
jgi:hypothetical protein